MSNVMDLMWLEHQLRTYPKKDRPVINWTCSACTFINRSYMDECEICDTKHITKVDGHQDTPKHS